MYDISPRRAALNVLPSFVYDLLMERWTKERIADLLDRLETLYGRSRFIVRFDPLEELVSCILSQSSSDSSSFPAFTRLLEAFPDWHSLACAPSGAVEDAIRSCGLAKQKAHAIQSSLRLINERLGEYSLETLRGWKMADAMRWLMDLPGVGPKTASIVLGFSFGMPAIPVDTHVFRVCKRLGIVSNTVGEAKAHAVLLQMVAPGDAHRFHTLLIQHGRHDCSAKSPTCDSCIVLASCHFGMSRIESVGANDSNRIQTRPRTN